MKTKSNNKLLIVPAEIIMRKQAEKSRKEKQLTNFLRDLYYPDFEAILLKRLKGN